MLENVLFIQLITANPYQSLENINLQHKKYKFSINSNTKLSIFIKIKTEYILNKEKSPIYMDFLV